MFKKIGTIVGALTGITVSGLMAFNTIDPLPSVPFIVASAVVGLIFGSFMGNATTLDEPYYDWDNNHYPSVGRSVASGLFSGIFSGAFGWVVAALVISAIVGNF